MVGNQIRLHDYCVSLGFTDKRSKEYKRAYEAEKWRRLTPEEKKAKRKQQMLRKKWRRQNDVNFLEKERLRDRKRKAKKRLENKDKVNEYQRKKYREAGEQRRKLINDGKYRRDPTRGLATLINDVKSGRRQPREIIAKLCDTIDKCGTLMHRGKRTSVS